MTIIRIFGIAAIIILLVISFGCTIAYIYEGLKLMWSKNDALSEEES